MKKSVKTALFLLLPAMLLTSLILTEFKKANGKRMQQITFSFGGTD